MVTTVVSIALALPLLFLAHAGFLPEVAASGTGLLSTGAADESVDDIVDDCLSTWTIGSIQSTHTFAVSSTATMLHYREGVITLRNKSIALLVRANENVNYAGKKHK